VGEVDDAAARLGAALERIAGNATRKTLQQRQEAEAVAAAAARLDRLIARVRAGLADQAA
jgi:hypothetical protein